MEKGIEIDMENYLERKEERSSAAGLVTKRMKCTPERNPSTPGRNIIAKWFYCSYRPFMRCYMPWEMIDFLLFFSFFAFNALAFYLIGGFHHVHSLKETGKDVGTLIQWSFLVLLMPITRNGIFQWIFGSSWERVIVLHKWFARWAVILMIIHTIIFIIYYANSLSEFLKFDIIAGEVAGLLMIFISITSLPCIRRRFFQIFMKSHYLFFTLIIIFAALHKHGSDLLLIISPALLLYAVDEGIRAINIVRYDAHVISLSPIGRSYLAIRLKLNNGNNQRGNERSKGNKMIGWMKRKWRKMEYHSYQWSNLYFPSISFFQLHPFSFASSPLVDQNHLLFIVKKESQWTKKLYEKVKKYQDLHPDMGNQDQNRMIKTILPFVQLDGPYGSITNGKPRRYSIHLLISGGVGFTPNFSLFKSLVYENAKKNVNEKMKIIFVWTGRGANLFRFTQSLFLPSLLSSLHRSSSSSHSSSPSPSPFSFNLLKQNFIREMTGIERANGEEEEGLMGEGEGDVEGSFSHKDDDDDDDRRRLENYSLIFDEMTSYSELYDIRLFQSAIDSTEIVPEDDHRNFPPIKIDHQNDDQKMGEMMKEMSAVTQRTHEIDQFIQLGRPDLTSIFDEVKSYAKLNHKGKVSVFACGPAPLVRKCLRLSSIHSSPFVRFDAHHERFDI